jgi:MarR family transcriptional regulator, organic hydroperoxide resistance regulator
MNKAKQLAGLIDDIIYHFGAHNMDDECCEGISYAEFRALRAAMREDSCTMQDIAKSAVVTKSGATRIISRLEEKGLVQRQQDKKDGRVCCVNLTESGRSFLNRNEDKLTNQIDSILDSMDPAMREVLIISLNSFLKVAQLKNS